MCVILLLILRVESGYLDFISTLAYPMAFKLLSSQENA
jgi:hypothetical protein